MAEIDQEAILGMDFFTRRDYGFSFTDATFTLEGEELKCVDQDGSLCVSPCHAQRDISLRPGEEALLQCRLTQAVNFAEGIVEGISNNPAKVLVARSLCCVQQGRVIVVRCLNTSGTPMEVRAGTPVAQFSQMEQVRTSELPV